MLDRVIPYIAADIPQTQEGLLHLTYAARHNETTLTRRDLAERFEALDRDWLLEEAIRLYRAASSEHQSAGKGRIWANPHRNRS